MMTWPLNIGLIAVAMLVTTLAASVYLTRVHGWSAQTAMFAAVPGALSQVVVMAADRDADLRGIVVVQTVRAIATTIGVPIALILFGLAGPAQFPVSGPGLIEAPWQAALLVVAAIAAALALYRVGFSGGFFFGPMVVSAFLHGSGYIELRPPGWFANMAMVGLGAVNGSRLPQPRSTRSCIISRRRSARSRSRSRCCWCSSRLPRLPLRCGSRTVVSYAPGAVDAR
jgi:uncharacterized membrane protein AbrB (regulator of aidB expression)